MMVVIGMRLKIGMLSFRDTWGMYGLDSMRTAILIYLESKDDKSHGLLTLDVLIVIYTATIYLLSPPPPHRRRQTGGI
jgi:uncharacterized membrane protein